jgi:SET domain-containing protein
MTNTTIQYRPLPDQLHVGMSKIEGNGLFTSSDIPKDSELGITHIKNNSGDFHSNFIRTPLAGFANHKPNNPNCQIYECGEYLKMKTILDIQKGDELTLNYTLYEPCKNYVNE